MSPLLNWARGHMARAEAPCHHCHLPTFLRDDDGLPSHKVCAEEALDIKAARAAANYRKDQL